MMATPARDYLAPIGHGDCAPLIKIIEKVRADERERCVGRDTQLLNSHPHAPPSPHEIIFAIRHPSGE